MKGFKELAYIISKGQIPYIKILSNEAFKKGVKSKYYQYYEYLVYAQSKDEDQFAYEIGLTPDDPKYLRFKREFTTRVLNSILYLKSVTKKSSPTKTRDYLIVRLAAVRIAGNLGARRLARKELKTIIKHAILIEQYSIALEALVSLKAILATLPQFQKEYKSYFQTYSKVKATKEFEMLIVDIYENFIINSNNAKGFNQEKTEQLSFDIDKLQEILGILPLNSSVFTNYFYTLKLYYVNSKGNPNQTIELCQEALNVLEKNKSIDLGALLRINLILITNLMVLKDSKTCKDRLGKLNHLANPGTANWFKLNEIKTIVLINFNDFDEAWNITQTCLNHDRYKLISPLDQETWKLVHGYLFFLIKVGTIKVSNRTKGDASKEAIQLIQSEMPYYNKDKRGANISLLLLQILFALADKEYDLIESRVEALRKYKQRNLDTKHEHFRVDCFIRMLEMMVKHNFNYKKIIDRTPKWLEKLQGKNIDVMNRSYEVEVLPYEVQWDWILQLLQRK